MEYRYTHLTNSVLAPQYFISYYIDVAYNIMVRSDISICYNGSKIINCIQRLVFNKYYRDDIFYLQCNFLHIFSVLLSYYLYVSSSLFFAVVKMKYILHILGAM